jgi:acetyltransferase-like isoleucine patch superfamily enzyme
VNVVDGGSLHIGEGSNIEAGCQLVTEGELRIGPRAFVGTGSVIVANQRVIIGCDALIAAYVTIRDDAHKMEPGDLPYNRQGLATAPIDIGNNVWLGTKATVLRGVSIGDGAVVAAHAVVRSHVEARTLVGGIPAKLLRKLADRSSAGPAN